MKHINTCDAVCVVFLGVCVYVCMYVCMYVLCMHELMDVARIYIIVYFLNYII